jgi:hypothetical protein
MHVQVLETVSYDAQGGARRCEKVVRPSWPQIEAAVRRLDRKLHPYMFLWPSESSATRMLDEFCERMEIMGGDGLYWLAGTFDGSSAAS